MLLVQFLAVSVSDDDARAGNTASSKFREHLEEEVHALRPIEACYDTDHVPAALHRLIGRPKRDGEAARDEDDLVGSDAVRCYATDHHIIRHDETAETSSEDSIEETHLGMTNGGPWVVLGPDERCPRTNDSRHRDGAQYTPMEMNQARLRHAQY